jgi:hypothetical protein
MIEHRDRSGISCDDYERDDHRLEGKYIDDEDLKSLFHIDCDAAEQEAMAEMSVLEDPSCLGGMGMNMGLSVGMMPNMQISPSTMSRATCTGLALGLSLLGGATNGSSQELLYLPSLASRRKSSALLSLDEDQQYCEPDVSASISVRSRSHRREVGQENRHVQQPQHREEQKQKQQQSQSPDNVCTQELEEICEREELTRTLVGDLQGALRKALEENADLLKDVQKLLNTCTDLDGKRRAASKDLRKLRKRVDYMEEQKEVSEEELKRLVSNQPLKEEQHAAELHQQLKEQSTQTKKQAELMEDEIQKVKKELQAKKEEQSRANYSFEKTCQLMRDENKLLREERFTLSEKLQTSNVNSNIRTPNDQQWRLENQNTELEKQVEVLKNSNKALYQEIETVATQLKEVKEDQSEAASATESYYSVKLKNGKKEWHEERKALQGQVQKSQTKMEELQKTLDQERGFKTFAWRRIRHLEIAANSNSKQASGKSMSCTSGGTAETAHSSLMGAAGNGCGMFSISPPSSGTDTAGAGSNLAQHVSNALSFFAVTDTSCCESCGATMMPSSSSQEQAPYTAANFSRRLVSKMVPALIAHNGGGHGASANNNNSLLGGPHHITTRVAADSTNRSQLRDELEKTSRGGATEKARRQDLGRLLLCTSSTSDTRDGAAINSEGKANNAGQHAKRCPTTTNKQGQDAQKQQQTCHGHDELQQAFGFQCSSC